MLKTTNSGGSTYSCNPVFITSQPTSSIACIGNTATFAIGANGSPPYNYRWYKNGVLVDSTISSLNNFNSYTTASLTSTDSGSIVYCVISNKCWDNTTSLITSDTANLVVNPVCTPVSLVNGLGNIYYTIGISSYPIMSITVAGTPPFIYHWYSGSSLVQTDTLYSTSCTYQQWPALIIPGIYSISCTVTNCSNCGSGSGSGAGSVTSFGSLNVYCPSIYIFTHPINQSKSICQTATFSVSLNSGDPSIVYAWFKNGTYIPGTYGPFNSSYTTPALTSADNGNTYYCKVTSCNGIMMNQSNTATLTIIQPASIIQQPTNQNLLPGTTATFNASVNGPPPFSYYWYTNGVLSSSTLNTFSTTSSFTTPLLTSGDINNSYYCIITNGAGCYTVTSDTAHFNCASFNSISPTACDSFSINGQTFTTSGIYTQTLVSQNGCDSTLTINLIVTNLIDSILQNGATLSSSISGANYQWVDCENGLAPIPGATNQSFNPTVNGFYALIISKGLCVDTSACFNVNSVGINILDFEEGISIFPSPVKNVLQISSSSMQLIEVNLYSSIGALLIEQKQTKKQVSIDLSSYANGIYFVEIKTDKGHIRKKVVKE
ncbi:MAG: immunoglobulin domain-containing protein [Bacteroidetes bacterium]|nr:immunoglobulin domain-containing protein [Bacteroidota bacterium]